MFQFLLTENRRDDIVITHFTLKRY